MHNEEIFNAFAKRIWEEEREKTAYGICHPDQIAIWAASNQRSILSGFSKFLNILLIISSLPWILISTDQMLDCLSLVSPTFGDCFSQLIVT